ncbi:glycine cleavage system protein GcvH [Thermosphaera aggregans]|uniref:Probable glycine cleavage system H protein n=1 Tax=Thermosphaera aggregans (strain DSM 11486 / M11TL) TaxID=633148 RepID=D5U0N0_THEAM|nr:glycine cleavage system protein GcvH [Thermosphaera aggregans]ADG90680.1 glycine cleavage system H protein [Thermosphaera aggregans DSM 11486]
MSEDIVVELKSKKYIVKKDRRYTETDEWAKLEGSMAIVGLTDYAQKELKDIVSIELPEVGRKVRKGEELGVVDSIKASSSYYSPLTGEVVEVNEKLTGNPELVNKDPYGEGWVFKIRVENPGEYNSLLTPEKYAEKVKTSHH